MNRWDISKDTVRYEEQESSAIYEHIKELLPKLTYFDLQKLYHLTGSLDGEYFRFDALTQGFGSGDAQRFAVIYDGFHSKNKGVREHRSIMNNFLRADILLKFVLNSIDIMEEKYKKFGLVELRPYKNEKHLVVGCGNYAPLGNFRTQMRETLTDLHNHDGCYTVDSNILNNPSVIAYFGVNELYNIPDASFEKITIEKMMGCDEGEIYEKELIRLLKEGGKVIRRCTTLIKRKNSLWYEKNDKLYSHRVEMQKKKEIVERQKMEEERMKKEGSATKSI